MNHSLLVVDDDPGSLEYMRLVLSGAKYRVQTATNGLEALLAIEAAPPDLVLTDLRMPEIDGAVLLQHVRQRWPGLPVILITVEQDLATVVNVIRQGASNYLVKPVKSAALLGAVDQVLAYSGGSSPQKGAVPELIGRSRVMVEVRQMVWLAARSEVNVLATGETGTGKELVAIAIHRYSDRGQGTLIAHNCATIPPDLFESTFFGHVRGAFTGADRDHEGLLEQADGGILFLDELEALSSVHQAKLLRVLDDGEVRRVGSNTSRRVSVRFVAATNQDPENMRREGTLRNDLYYRLRGYQIELPPLRKRQEDIPLLVAHFLAQGEASRPRETSECCIEPGVMAALQKHAWPGNVRELKNVVRSAASAAAGGPIKLSHLNLGARPLDWDETRAQFEGTPPSSARLKDLEGEAIRLALEHSGGNRGRAAQALGIDRSTLRRKLKELGLE